MCVCGGVPFKKSVVYSFAMKKKSRKFFLFLFFYLFSRIRPSVWPVYLVSMATFAFPSVCFCPHVCREMSHAGSELPVFFYSFFFFVL